MYIIIILNCIKIFDPTKMTRNCLFNIYFHVDRYHIHNALYMIIHHYIHYIHYKIPIEDNVIPYNTNNMKIMNMIIIISSR